LAAYIVFGVRQYEDKSYRMFIVEWLIEAYYLRTFIQLSHIPHYITLQKFAARITGNILESIISSFISLLSIRTLFIGIDSSGFKATNASQYYIQIKRKHIREHFHGFSIIPARYEYTCRYGEHTW
jgi:hypothetical protein